jgi:hypothetical protein
MADFIYTVYKNTMLIQGTNLVDWDADNINASLVRASTYTPNQTTDDFYDDVTTPVQEASGFLAPTVSGFNVDVTDFTFTTVAGGAAIDQLVIWKDTTVDSTSRLCAFYDISVTPNGNDINVAVHGSGLFDL